MADNTERINIIVELKNSLWIFRWLLRIEKIAATMANCITTASTATPYNKNAGKVTHITNDTGCPFSLIGNRTVKNEKMINKKRYAKLTSSGQ